MNQFKVSSLVTIASILLIQASGLVIERDELDFNSFDVSVLANTGSGSGSRTRRSIELDFSIESASGSGAFKARRSINEFGDLEQPELEFASESGHTKARRSLDDIASCSGDPQIVSIPSSTTPSPPVVDSPSSTTPSPTVSAPAPQAPQW
eukprot:Nk52_evm4s320 gene=Nk52_evmTU4s320